MKLLFENWRKYSSKVISEMEMTDQERAWADEQQRYQSGTETPPEEGLEFSLDEETLIQKFLSDDDPNVWDVMQSDENLEQEVNRQFIEQIIGAVNQTNLNVDAKLKLRSIWSNLRWSLEGDLWEKLLAALTAQGVDKV
jgi:hypothetical protein